MRAAIGAAFEHGRIGFHDVINVSDCKFSLVAVGPAVLVEPIRMDEESLD